MSLSNCTFNLSNLVIWDYVSSAGLLLYDEKMNELKTFLSPKDLKSLCRFLGRVGFHHKLIPNYANIVLPLLEHTRLFSNYSFELSNIEKDF